MKTYITLAMLLFALSQLSAQGYCKAWDWQWTDKSEENWMWNKSGVGSSGGLGSAGYFLGTGHINNNAILDKIDESNDYLKENGWELLYKDFGCNPFDVVNVNFPYFILYNKYTGKGIYFSAC